MSSSVVDPRYRAQAPDLHSHPTHTLLTLMSASPPLSPISAGASAVETSGSIGMSIGVVVGVIIALVLALVFMRRRSRLNDVRPAAPTGALAEKKAPVKNAAADLYT